MKLFVFMVIDMDNQALLYLQQAVVGPLDFAYLFIFHIKMPHQLK